MKRKLEASLTKRLPRLFGGKRSGSDREDEKSLVVQPETTPTCVPAPVVQPPKKDSRRSKTQPAQEVSFANVVQPREGPKTVLRATNTTTNAAPVDWAKSSLVPDATVPIGSIDSLDDFSLRRLLDKRLFAPDSASVEVIVAIRLAPNASSSSNQLASSLTRVLTKDEKRKNRDVLLVFTRLPEIRLHTVTSSTTSTLAVSWSFPLQALVAVREAKRGVVVLQFVGGKERRVVPVSEAEKGWLFYCATRLSREVAGGDPTILAFSSLRLIATEETLNSRCPFLAQGAQSGNGASPQKSRTVASVRKTDISFSAGFETFEPSSDSDDDDDRESYRGPSDAISRPKRASLLASEEETRVLDKALAPKAKLDAPESMIERAELQLSNLERDTLNELRAWEAGNGPIIPTKTITDLEHGRKGDPIASLLAHLEDVEYSLRELDEWMNDHDSAVLGMSLLARKIDSEITGMREEGLAKEQLASHLTELLQDITVEDEQTLTELHAILPMVQRELESYQVNHPFTHKVLRACQAVCDLRDRGGHEGKVMARKDRYLRMKDRASQVGAKLSEFLQSRLDYYYKFERNEVREAHGRLATYSELLKMLSVLSPAHCNQVSQRYQAEAGMFVRTELSKLLDANFSSLHTSDTMAKFPDCVVDSLENYPSEREAAFKEVHVSGVESRKKFFLRLINLIREEDAFCLVLGGGFDFTPGLNLALDGVWQGMSQKANSCPVSFAAPVLCDTTRLMNTLAREDRAKYVIVLRERFATRLQECLDRFLTEQAIPFFEKTKRSHPIFVRKYPALLDRLEAAAHGFGLAEAVESDPSFPCCQQLSESALQLISTVTNPFQRLENIFFVASALRIRQLPGLEHVQADVDKRLENAIDDIVAALLESSCFALVVRLVKFSDEDEAFGFSRFEMDQALSALQGNVEKSIQQVKLAIETKLSAVKLRSNVAEATRDALIDSYWRFAEMAAENFGVKVQPTAGMVKDAWIKAS